MSIEKLRYKEDGFCEICLQHKPTMEITVVIAAGHFNVDEEVEICKECFNFNWDMTMPSN